MVRGLDTALSPGLQALKDGHSHQHNDGAAGGLSVGGSVVQRVAEVRVSANQAAVRSAVAHNFGTDYRRYVHRDCIDVDMEPGCWALHLEFVVVAHGDHLLEDQPSLPVVGACGHSNMATYTFFLCCRWYDEF